jgi:hypothetical protein
VVALGATTFEHREAVDFFLIMTILDKVTLQLQDTTKIFLLKKVFFIRRIMKEHFC